jgi:hypothetical protein
MIFISHTHADKPIVEPIAIKLSSVFGQENVFYDSWSIQPGDGIINEMNEGLKKCKFFFFFVSKKSLNSGLVKLEWQNALMISAKEEIKFIPVKIDDCNMPEILLQNLYIDVNGNGIDVATRQIIDVINGKNTFHQNNSIGYKNIRAYVSSSNSSIRVEFRAETYMEPQSKFLIALGNPLSEFSYKIEGISLPSNILENQNFDGKKVTMLPVAKTNPTSPGFPCVVNLIPQQNVKIKIIALMHAISNDQYKDIPVILE